MFASICKALTQRVSRLVLGVAFSAALSGCLANEDGMSFAQHPDELTVLHRAPLASGAVVVVPPTGYCIEKKSLREKPGGGFALMAACAELTGQVSGVLVEPAILTVAVVDRASTTSQPNVEEIAAALGDRKVLQRINGDGLAVVQVVATEALSQTGDPRHWRGMMIINGKMVGLALYGAKNSAVTGEPGLVLLMQLAEQIRANSPAGSDATQKPVVVAKPPAKSAADASKEGEIPASDERIDEKDRPTGLNKLFGRLFL
ncbi:hypothetical protein [Thalassovita taeanensis]|uniref:Dihydroxy-acid dehydratase n=1 Tax=Thalassovita taeanensis TaxID=657014 RepID=A0A1H9DPN3_9RHOB|nr:hypothetical protein [Thalassovita taeanensis]SEQ15442.1 hypothetical protein SAMN04488092_104237 [Thalassovita taeanensis]